MYPLLNAFSSSWYICKAVFFPEKLEAGIVIIHGYLLAVFTTAFVYCHLWSVE